MEEQISGALKERLFAGRPMVIKLAKEMDALGESFSMTYLSKKDVRRQTGEITVVIMHSPFGDNCSIDPQILTYPVKIPFSKGELKNKLRSPRAGGYLVNEWVKKISLVVAAGISLVRKVNDIENPTTDQQAEGMNNSDIALVPDIRKPGSDMGAWI